MLLFRARLKKVAVVAAIALVVFKVIAAAEYLLVLCGMYMHWP